MVGIFYSLQMYTTRMHFFYFEKATITSPDQ